jgi:hypothetical protein
MKKKFQNFKDSIINAKEEKLPGESEKNAICEIKSFVSSLADDTVKNYASKRILNNLNKKIIESEKTIDFDAVRGAVKDAIDSLREEITTLKSLKPGAFKLGLTVDEHIFITNKVENKLSEKFAEVSKNFGLEEQEHRSFFQTTNR